MTPSNSIITFKTCCEALCGGFLIGILTVVIFVCGLYSGDSELAKPLLINMKLIHTHTPSISPTNIPTNNPTKHPSKNPTHHPTINPTNHPTQSLLTKQLIKFLSDSTSNSNNKTVFIENNRFKSSMYRRYVSQTFVNHVRNDTNVIESYCTHFLKVEFDSYCQTYEIKYSLDTDIVYNYYPKLSNIKFSKFNTTLNDSITAFVENTNTNITKNINASHDIIEIYLYCKYKYPIDNTSVSKILIGNVSTTTKKLGYQENNVANIISNMKYWQKRFYNKTIVFFGDSVARRLGYGLRSLVNGKKFSDNGDHGEVQMHLNNNLTMRTNIVSFYKPCTEYVWKFSHNHNYEKLGRIFPKENAHVKNTSTLKIEPIDYFLLIV